MYYVTNKVYLKMYKIISIIFIEYSLINFVIMLELLIYIYIYIIFNDGIREIPIVNRN